MRKNQKPCSNCPFRTDRPFKGLTIEKAADIVQGLYSDTAFHCHKTCDYSESGSGVVTPDSTLCIGAAIFLEQTKKTEGGMLSNLTFRIGYATGQIDPLSLSSEIPVYKTVEEFLDGST